jgi:hypothetical protein
MEWKIENESFNVLKNHGYELEHNFGHGQKFLAMTLAALNLLAFAWHTVLDLLEPSWQAAREAAAKRTSFFAHTLMLTAYLEPPELDPGVFGCELPIGLGVVLVSMALPSGDFFFQSRFVGNASAQAWARQNGEFGFGHVEPTSMFGRVMPFEPIGEAARYGRRLPLRDGLERLIVEHRRASSTP